MTQTLDRRTFIGAVAAGIIAAPLPAKAQSGVSLSATPTTLVVGDVVTVTWSGINVPNGTEWIGLYATGADPDQYLAWIYVNGTTSPGGAFASGSVPFTVPNVSGSHEFRLFANNYNYTLLATSNPVTVGGGGGGGTQTYPFATGTLGTTNVAQGAWSLAGGSGSQTAVGANGAFAWGQGAVAAGGGSIAFGRNAKSMYTDTFVVGQGCQAHADNGRAAGWVCLSTGDQGYAHGYQASDRGIDRLEAYSGGSFGTGSEDLGSATAQMSRAVLRAQTYNATPTPLTTDGRAFGFNNQMRLPDDATYVLQWLVAARDTSNGDSRAWRVLAMATRGAGAWSTTVFAPVITNIANSPGAIGWNVSLTADTYNGAIQLNGIGQAGKPIQWVAAMIDSENVG